MPNDHMAGNGIQQHFQRTAGAVLGIVSVRHILALFRLYHLKFAILGPRHRRRVLQP